MDTSLEWYTKCENRILECKRKYNKKTQRQYKLDLILRLAKGVDKVSYQCSRCENVKKEIEGLIEDLEQQRILSKYEKKEYLKRISAIKRHLTNKHRLVVKGDIVSSYLTIGLACGATFGLTVFNTLYYGLVLGILSGILIGKLIERKAKLENRLI
jgi:hypothetical protein